MGKDSGHSSKQSNGDESVHKCTTFEIANSNLTALKYYWVSFHQNKLWVPFKNVNESL